MRLHIGGSPGVIRFRFQLTPVAEVAPWGSGGPVLHWFGLTDGWYSIEVAGYPDPPKVDYYLARLWDDLIQLTHALSEPVPMAAAEFLRSDVNILDTWPDDLDWPDDEATDAALALKSSHTLDFGFVRNAPRVKSWRHLKDGNDLISLTWRSQPNEGISPSFEVTMPTTEFLDAVKEFHRSLIAAMAARVSELEHDGVPEGVGIDLALLRQEHNRRARWLSRTPRISRQTDWDLVLAGIATLTTPPIQARPLTP